MRALNTILSNGKYGILLLSEQEQTQQLIEENLSLKLALAELAEKQETEKLELQMALAELAEILLGGV
ncbi:MAG: hypothetical protein K0S71_554 [Clostridia bacterium]|nr:hypothetical protein [Clostridia bacterium]